MQSEEEHFRRYATYYGMPYNPYGTREAYSHSYSNQYLDMQRQVLLGEAVWDGYMHGVGNSWGVFTKDEIIEQLEEFSIEHGLSIEDLTEARDWVESLPWSDDSIDLHFAW